MDQVHDVIRFKYYSSRTEQTYIHWIRRFILVHQKRHPKEMGAPEIEAFLTNLAVHQKVAASTQNQALSAILFLYQQVLRLDNNLNINAIRENSLAICLRFYLRTKRLLSFITCMGIIYGLQNFCIEAIREVF